MKLRDYQADLLARIDTAAGPVLCSLATGGGKTAIAAHVSRRHQRALFVAPSRAITDQA